MKSVKTLLPEQVSSRLLAETIPSVYKFYEKTLSQQEIIHIEIAKDLRLKALQLGLLPKPKSWPIIPDDYGYFLPAMSGFIHTSGDIQLIFNHQDNDYVSWNISDLGSIWTLAQGDLIFTDLWLKNPSYSGSISLETFLTGSPNFSM